MKLLQAGCNDVTVKHRQQWYWFQDGERKNKQTTKSLTNEAQSWVEAKSWEVRVNFFTFRNLPKKQNIQAWLRLRLWQEWWKTEGVMYGSEGAKSSVLSFTHTNRLQQKTHIKARKAIGVKRPGCFVHYIYRFTLVIFLRNDSLNIWLTNRGYNV